MTPYHLLIRANQQSPRRRQVQVTGATRHLVVRSGQASHLGVEPRRTTKEWSRCKSVAGDHQANRFNGGFVVLHFTPLSQLGGPSYSTVLYFMWGISVAVMWWVRGIWQLAHTHTTSPAHTHTETHTHTHTHTVLLGWRRVSACWRGRSRWSASSRVANHGFRSFPRASALPAVRPASPQEAKPLQHL
jgi:hypothetical protein